MKKIDKKSHTIIYLLSLIVQNFAWLFVKWYRTFVFIFHLNKVKKKNATNTQVEKDSSPDNY